MTIGLCIICKGTNNEQSELQRLIDSVNGYVDTINITTTQKKDDLSYLKTSSRLNISHFQWNDNFSDARNYNFSTAKEDYLLWLDSDDVLVGSENIKKVVSQMERSKLDAVYFDYNYEIDENGNVVINHPRERIVKNGVFEWKGALHETLVPKRQPKTLYIRDLYVEHYPSAKSRVANMERNIRILSTQYQKEREQVLLGKSKEIDPRTEYYLARCLFDTHTKKGYERAELLFQDYLEHSGWDEERAQAWNYLGNIYYLTRRYDEAENCFLSAIKERPEYPTWHIGLSRVYVAKKEWKKAEFHIKTAISTPQPNTALVITPLDDQINTLICLFLIHFQKGELELALKTAKKLYRLQPTKDNESKFTSVQKLIKWGEWIRSVREMADELMEAKEEGKILGLLSSLPEQVQKSDMIGKLRMQLLPSKIWDKNSIVYYCGPGFESWSPKSMQSGIGGSEEAVIYLSKFWVAQGYKVTVYGYPGTDEGIYDGVEYLNYYRFNPQDKFDIFIGWRNPYLFNNDIVARVKLLDLHDVPEYEAYKNDINVDKIMVKSEYHKSLLPESVYKKVIVVGNGIDTSLLEKIEGNNSPVKVFYGSSYDRGLYGLLKIWPEVKKAVSDAELHICYGWNLFEQLYAHNPMMMKWKSEMEELMKADGIVHHGRVGKDELYEIAKSCGVWAYPTIFEEIYCITGAYCQALGLTPVVYNYAALETTVKFGKKLELNPHNSDSLNIYKKELIKTIKSPENNLKMIQWAMDEFNWQEVAKKWIEVML